MAKTDTLSQKVAETPTPTYHLTFPTPENTPDQNEEWCELTIDGHKCKLRFHDYDQIFELPGLYEQLFHDKLKCQSPELIAKELIRAALAKNIQPETLRVLDFGAGNGLVAQALYDRGVRQIVGADILPEAKSAAARDRGHVYKDYAVCDFSALSEPTAAKLANEQFNALTTVAALGFDDVPLAAFRQAYELLNTGGMIGFNIRDKFLDEAIDDSGFHSYISGLLEHEIEVVYRQTYVHRLNVAMAPIRYEAIIGQKKR